MGILTIKTLSELSGVNAHTIRAWERRYKALTPKRSRSGHRSYSMEDLSRIRLLNKLINSGFTIGQVATLPTSKLQDVLVKKSTGVATSPQNSVLPELGQVFEAVSGFDVEKIHDVLGICRVKYGSLDFAVKVAVPILNRIGALVAMGQLSISQEHIFSAVLRDQIALATHSVRRFRNTSKGTFSFLTPDGDFHEFGILLSELMCMSHGFQSQYLGCSLPEDSVKVALQASNAKYVVIGAIENGEMDVSARLESLVRYLDKNVSRPLEFILGGNASASVDKTGIKSQIHFMESLPQLQKFLEVQS